MPQLFSLGLITGLLLAAPFGPAGALAIRQTIGWGFRGGIACGVGTALADAMIGSLVGLGIGFVTAWLAEHIRPLEIVAGVILVGVGATAFLELGTRTKARNDEIASGQRLAAAGGQAFLVTLGNPTIAGAFAAMFTALGIHTLIEEAAWGQALVALGGGIFLGSITCWTAFVWFVGHVSDRVADAWLHRVHRILGAVLVAVGLVVISGVVV